MSLTIKDEETLLLASEVAQITGESMTGAVTVALRERLEREIRVRRAEALLKELDAIAKRSAERCAKFKFYSE